MEAHCTMNPATQASLQPGQPPRQRRLPGGRRAGSPIDPITRLEGHGKIEIFLDDKGDVERAYLQVPELRGFEVFCLGRPAEDMPQITSRICGVCPTAHHMASTKALDDLYKVEPTSAGRKIRELVYNTFMLEDHALHFFVLGGPDFIVGPEAPARAAQHRGRDPEGRHRGGQEGHREPSAAARADRLLRRQGRAPGARPARRRQQGPQSRGPAQVQAACPDDGLEFALWTLEVFKHIVLANPEYVKLITSDAYTHKTYYMGMVDDQNRVNFYDGKIRVVDCNGKEVCKFAAQQYLDLCGRARRAVELHEVHLPQAAGLEGLRGRAGHEHLLRGPAGPAERGRRHGHAARRRPAYEEFYKTLGGKPVHHTLGQPLGARHRDGLRGRAHAGARQRPRDHQPRGPPPADERAEGRHRCRRSPARHAVPPLRDGRAGPDPQGQPDRRDAATTPPASP